MSVIWKSARIPQKPIVEFATFCNGVPILAGSAVEILVGLLDPPL